MKPLIVLITTFLISVVVLKIRAKQIDYRFAGRIAMACMLLFTAIGHFVFTDGMVVMVPDFLPFKSKMVLITGYLEVLFALGLLLPKYKRLTGILLILFLFIVLPSNIKAAVQNLNYRTGALDGPGVGYLWFRIPLQVLFVLWVYFSAIRK